MFTEPLIDGITTEVAAVQNVSDRRHSNVRGAQADSLTRGGHWVCRMLATLVRPPSLPQSRPSTERHRMRIKSKPNRIWWPMFSAAAWMITSEGNMSLINR